MRRFISKGFQNFEVLEWHEGRPKDSFKEFRDRFSALEFLRGFKREHLSMITLRKILAGGGFNGDLSRLKDQDVLEQLALRLVSRQLKILELPFEVPAWSHVEPAVEEETAESVAAVAPETAWVKFQVIDDATGNPISGVNLKIKLPDGSQKDATTREDGMIEYNGIIPGTCKVSCDIKDARLEDTLAFVKLGDAAVNRASQEKTTDKSGTWSHVALIEEHKVKSGETLESVAKEKGLTWQELAKFNWDTNVPEEINKFLREDVGCTKKTTDRKNYKFDNSDTPGIVLIPRTWSHSGLQTDVTHFIRVRPMLRVFDYAFELVETGGEEEQEPIEEYVNLAFSVKGAVPPGLKVRLYECNNLVELRKRVEMIKVHAAKQGDKAGLIKSGRYHKVEPGETLDVIAKKHGLSSGKEIFENFENNELREFKSSPSEVNEDDYIYIPQLKQSTPIPLGELMDVEEVDELVPGAKRFQAKWAIEENHYNPLDFDAWQPESELGVVELGDLEFNLADQKTLPFYLPQFAVLDPELKPIGVSPTPMWLVHKAQFESPTESKRMHVIFADGTTREVRSEEGIEDFETNEEPLTFFGAEGEFEEETEET